ncbi:MAG: Rid family detoxifying hydrolase [Bacteroidales bacterium]|nr:Rid family detoxifying hydrolase [Candidatus Latescibacterota bacterium]
MKKIISTDKAPAAVGPYSQAVKAGNMLFISGQVGLDPATGKMVEGLENQVERVLENLKAVVEEAGGTMGSIVKATVLLQSMDDFKTMNGIYSRYFTEDPPARAAFAVAALPLGALVEITAIALIDQPSSE